MQPYITDYDSVALALAAGKLKGFDIYVPGKDDFIYLSGPKDAPRGTRPIDRWGLSTGDIHKIKDDLKKRGNEWVGITPDGIVITVGPKGEAVNEGHVNSYVNRPIKKFE